VIAAARWVFNWRMRVMRVLNAEGFGQRADQMFLVHLGVALNRFVLVAFRHFAQIGECHVF
jgi:hypothetical protein